VLVDDDAYSAGGAGDTGHYTRVECGHEVERLPVCVVVSPSRTVGYGIQTSTRDRHGGRTLRLHHLGNLSDKVQQ